MKKFQETVKNIWGKIIDFIKNNKKIAIIVGLVLLIIIIALILFLIFTKDRTNEHKLENSLKEMAQEFYEDYYYDYAGKTNEERAETVKKYKDMGLKIDLENLGRYNGQKNKERIKEFVNSETNEACNAKNTRAIIYPNGNFSKTDYEIKIELDCGFKTEEAK